MARFLGIQPVDEAKALGADGIINMKIEYIPSYLSNHKYPNDGYSATGMAIKQVLH